ncbi:MAG: hypothetical protein KTR33_10180 [Gammaproteobacteria bacterium]|nr:hypothetical protein [Gammaproteobacteria bacterium]
MQIRISIAVTLLLTITLAGCDNSSSEGQGTAVDSALLPVSTLEAIAQRAENGESARLDLVAIESELDSLTAVSQLRGPATLDPGDSVLSVLRKARAQ